MKKIGMHPPIEKLVEYALRPGEQADEGLHQHLLACKACRSEMEKYQQISSYLSNYLDVPHIDPEQNHISDEQLLLYTDNKLSHEQEKHIQEHIVNCGGCAKAVLLLQTHQKKLREQYQFTTNSVGKTVLSKNKDFSFIRGVREFFIGHSRMLTAVTAVVVLVFISMPLIVHGPDTNRDLYLNDSTERIANSGEFTPHHNSNGKPFGIQKVTNGVNWYDGYIETTAIGTVDMNKMKNRVQAEITAEKTARHIAYSQLSELMNGVYVTNNVMYKTLLMEVDDLSVKTEGFLRAAEVTQRKVEWVNDTPKISVTVRLPLYGYNGLNSIIGDTRRLTEANIFISDSTSSSSDGTSFSSTGIIIDARNTPFRPALNPSVTDKDGTLIFPLLDELPGSGEKYKWPLYFSSPEQEDIRLKTGPNPYIVKASMKSSTGRIVLDKNIISIVKTTIANEQNVAIVF